jgi:hypothetical protein
MVSYKDRTWCASPNCKGECGRQFTEQDRLDAIQWWGGGSFPISMSDFCGGGDITDTLTCSE